MSRRFNQRFCPAVAVGVVLSIAVIGGMPAAAGTPELAYPTPDVTLRIEDGAIRLGLPEAIEIALERNLPLLVQRYDRRLFELRLDGSRGIYDLGLSGSAFTNEETQPSASDLDGADVVTSKQQGVVLGLDQLTPFGGTAEVDFRNFRNETNSTFSFLNPNYFVELDLVFSQPLLRNFGRDVTERGIRIAQIGDKISAEQLELQVTGTVRSVVNAYWNLLYARAQLEVARTSVSLATELHDMNKVRVEVGTMAPLELVQSEAGIATRQEEVIRSESRVGDAEDLIRQLLDVAPGRLWSLEIVPDTDPLITRPEIDLDQALEVALANRPELAQKGYELEQLDLDQAYYANQAKPSLGVQVRYGWNGLGGDVVQPVLDGDGNPTGETIVLVPGGYGDAFEQITDRDFDGWQIGLQFAYPLQNRTAKARVLEAQLDAEQGQVELRQLQQRILTEVRSSARAVTTAAEQIDSARASLRLAEKNLDAERKRYDNGMSTSFQVLQIQEDLSEAQSREVNAVTLYRIALVAYYQSLGTLLDEIGVSLGNEG